MKKQNCKELIQWYVCLLSISMSILQAYFLQQ